MSSESKLESLDIKYCRKCEPEAWFGEFLEEYDKILPEERVSVDDCFSEVLELSNEDFEIVIDMLPETSVAYNKVLLTRLSLLDIGFSEAVNLYDEYLPEHDMRRGLLAKMEVDIGKIKCEVTASNREQSLDNLIAIFYEYPTGSLPRVLVTKAVKEIVEASLNPREYWKYVFDQSPDQSDLKALAIYYLK